VIPRKSTRAGTQESCHQTQAPAHSAEDPKSREYKSSDQLAREFVDENQKIARELGLLAPERNSCKPRYLKRRTKLELMNATDSIRSSTAPPYAPTPETRKRKQRYRRYRRNMKKLSKQRRNFPEKTNERIETAKWPPWRNLCWRAPTKMRPGAPFDRDWTHQKSAWGSHQLLKGSAEDGECLSE